MSDTKSQIQELNIKQDECQETFFFFMNHRSIKDKEKILKEMRVGEKH